METAGAGASLRVSMEVSVSLVEIEVGRAERGKTIVKIQVGAGANEGRCARRELGKTDAHRNLRRRMATKQSDAEILARFEIEDRVTFALLCPRLIELSERSRLRSGIV